MFLSFTPGFGGRVLRDLHADFADCMRVETTPVCKRDSLYCVHWCAGHKYTAVPVDNNGRDGESLIPSPRPSCLSSHPQRSLLWAIIYYGQLGYGVYFSGSPTMLQPFKRFIPKMKESLKWGTGYN